MNPKNTRFYSKIKTPSYIYYEKNLEKNIKLFQKFSKNRIKIFYAIKSNNFPS